MAYRSKKRPDIIAVLIIVIALGVAATELLKPGSAVAEVERVSQNR